MQPEKEPVDVGFDEIKKTTQKAMLVVISDTGEELWVPYSVIENLEDLVEEDGKLIAGPDMDTLVVKEWWAKKYGFTEED